MRTLTAAATTGAVDIGQIIRNAIAFNFKQQVSHAMNLDSIFKTVDTLFTLLATRQIDYLLVGGIAMLQYVEGRNTEDIDLIIALSSLQALPEINVSQRDANFARGDYNGLQIDLLLTQNRLFETVRNRFATTGRFGERSIAVVTVDGLLLLKLYALPSLYQQGNFARVGLYENDVATLLQAYSPTLAPLMTELGLHLSDTDLMEVREIVAEIQQRIERFGRRARPSA